MKIEVKIVRENKDGSATAQVDFDKEGLEFLVQEGLLSVLKQYIDRDENAKKGIAMRKRMATKKAGAKRVTKKNK